MTIACNETRLINRLNYEFETVFSIIGYRGINREWVTNDRFNMPFSLDSVTYPYSVIKQYKKAQDKLVNGNYDRQEHRK